MTRRRLLLVAVGMVVAGGIAGAAWALLPRDPSRVTEAQAVEAYRERTDGSAAPQVDGPEPPGRVLVPSPGVYTYRATGTEEVRLGPLPTQTRTLPDEVTAIVVAGEDGCFEVTVNLFAEHTEDTGYCTEAGGTITLAGHTKHQQIGGLSPTATVECDPAVLVDPDAEVTELACRMSLAGGPASITAELLGRATTGPAETRTVGDTEVEVTPVSIDYEITGDLTGTWSETQWLTDDHLAVRIERTLDLAGPATFSERSTLELTDLVPIG